MYNSFIHDTITYRSFKSFNEESFLLHLQKQPFSALNHFDCPDAATDVFLKIFSDSLNEHAPIKQKRVKHSHQPDWFSKNISEAIKARDKAKSEGNTEQFKHWRAQVKKQSFLSKKEFYSNHINNNTKNPKSLWKHLQTLAGKSNTHVTNYINDVQNNPITDPLHTAELFNSHFTNVFKSAPAQSHLNAENAKDITNYVQSKLNKNDIFQIPPVTEHFISKQLNLLDANKSTGLDGIGPRILKISANVISKPIAHVTVKLMLFDFRKLS